MFTIAASLFFATPATAQPPVDLTQVRASLEGNWEGRLEYLDYGANEWFGIPVKSTVSVGTFRKGREAEISVYTVRLESIPKSATDWTVIEETKSMDDNRLAMLRLTTVHKGDALETVQQIDFLDDEKTEWITRNRTRVIRSGK